MNDLFRRAESILDIASTPGAEREGTVIVLDRGGQVRVLSPEGWTLPALAAEFGAREIYVVRKLADSITVEGWSATDSCRIGRKHSWDRLTDLPQMNPASCSRSDITGNAAAGAVIKRSAPVSPKFVVLHAENGRAGVISNEWTPYHQFEGADTMQHGGPGNT